MLFCFLISTNAKCLCHLWTAKRANLGFSLIATVTSLLRLRWGVGGGNAWQEEDWRKEGWKDGDTALLTHGRGVKERGRPTERSLEESNSGEWGGQPALWKSPNTQLRGRRTQLRPALLAQLCWGDDSVKSGNCWTSSWHAHLSPPSLAQRAPTHQTHFPAILLIDTFIFVWNETCSWNIYLTSQVLLSTKPVNVWL